VKLAGDGCVPAHLSLYRPVGQRREPVARRRPTSAGGVGRRPRGDVAVAKRDHDVRPEVATFDGSATEQSRREDVLSQS